MNKHRVVRITAVAVTLFLLLAPATSASAGRPTAPQTPWTVLVYMDGDNNLERFVTPDFERELAQVGSNADVNVLVLADRTPGYSSGGGDWTSTKLFYVTQGMTATPENALADWGERNMGDPQTLVDFVQWAKANYPANHYALIFWDHGWGWRPNQTMWDETDWDALDPHEIVAAMQAAGPVDVVGYDACEQQMIEVEATWRPFTQAIVASQEDVWWEGFKYEEILAGLQANPAMTAEQLAVLMASTMVDKTIAAVALGASWDALLTAVDQWSVALLNGLPTYRAAYDAAYADTQAVLDLTNKDLVDAAAEIKAHVPDAAIQAKSQAVVDAAGAVMLYEWHRGKYHDAHGIGLFWPRLPADLDELSSPEYDFDYYRNSLVFSQLTHWDEFLDAYVIR